MSSNKSWTTRRDHKRQRLLRVASYCDRRLIRSEKIVQVLEELLEPGDRVCLEGNNQKQADFLSRMLTQVDPARIHSLHLLISVLSRPEHMELFERKIASRVDFSFAGPQASRLSEMVANREIQIGAIHTYLELFARYLVDLTPDISLIAADCADAEGNLYTGSPHISAETRSASRGLRWFNALTENPNANFENKSVLVDDSKWDGELIRVLSVVCNAHAKFPRARQGQVGIEEGWAIAKAVWDAIDGDEGKRRRAIVAIVDVPGQAFGWHEEALGIHLALAAAVDAYVTAREVGHPIIALVVGKAISGAFLAHGLQANEILALDDQGVEVHVMSEASAARVTRRSPKDVAALAKIVPSTARDVESFAGLGGIDRLIKIGDAGEPDAEALENVRIAILMAIERARKARLGLQGRLPSSSTQVSRAMSWQVRQELESQWTANS